MAGACTDGTGEPPVLLCGESRATGLRNSLNTRLTYEAAYTRYRNELEAVGVDTVVKFKRIIHSAQSLESAHRRKRLDEQRDGRWVLV